MPDPKKILFISANPWHPSGHWKTIHLALDHEFKVMQAALEKSPNAGEFHIRLCPAATVADFQSELLYFRPKIVHFCGHGYEDKEDPEKRTLGFADETNTEVRVRQDAIAEALRLAASHVECVVLNACWSEPLAEAVSAHVGYVVGMRVDIGDDAARVFSRGFYTSLFAGNWYTNAFDTGKNAIELKGIPEDQTPQLKIRDNAPRGVFVPGKRADIAILRAGAEAKWSDSLVRRLDDLLSQKLGGRNAFTLSVMGDGADSSNAPSAADAAMLLAVMSPGFLASGPCKDAVTAFLDAPGNDARGVTLLECAPVDTPDALLRARKREFWREDEAGNVQRFESNDSRFHNELNSLAETLAAELRKLKNREIQREEAERTKQQAAAAPDPECYLDALVFINALADDLELAHRIRDAIRGCGAGYSLPLILQNRHLKPAEARENLENNLIACDAALLIYGGAPLTWITEQVLYCRRMQRKRSDNPIRVIAVHNQAYEGKPTPDIRFPNLEIIDCPPDDVEKYLPRLLKKLREVTA